MYKLKSWKKMLSALMVLVMVFGIAVPVLAHGDDYVHTDSIYQFSQAEIDAEHQRQVDEFLSSLPQGRMEPERRTVEIGRRTERITMQAGGQSPNGTIFTSPHSGFIWADGTFYINIRLSVSFGDVGFSFGVGRTNAGVGGYTITSPFLFMPVLLHVTRDIQIIEWELQSRPFGSAPNAPWRVDSRFATTSTMQLRFDVRPVNGF